MQPQEVLDGRYRVEALVGRGGMGAVWRATDLKLDRLVAVKTLHEAAVTQDPNAQARFRREVRIAASINHPGVVAVTDYGVTPRTYYLVMEFIEGRTLASIIADNPAGLPIGAVVSFYEKLLTALAATHAKGVVHRDMKPSNLIVRNDTDALVLCDFGIGKSISPATIDHVSTTGKFSGTFDYASPEQIRGSFPIDQRSDLYASGCVLYEMITGRPPFLGTGPAKLGAHLHEPPIPPGRLRQQTPDWLNELTLSLLAKDAASRPESSTEVLHVVSQGEKISISTPTVMASTVSATGAPAEQPPLPDHAPGVPANPSPAEFFSALHARWKRNGRPTPYAIRRRIIESELSENSASLEERDLIDWIGCGATPRVRRDAWPQVESVLLALGVDAEGRRAWNLMWEEMWRSALEEFPTTERVPGARKSFWITVSIAAAIFFFWVTAATAAAHAQDYDSRNMGAAVVDSLLALFVEAVLTFLVVESIALDEFLIEVHEAHCIGNTFNYSHVAEGYLAFAGLIALVLGIWIGIDDPLHFPYLLGHWLGWRF
ncbi:serine/threonine-protein kinase [Streptomyces polygonati]|uniref:non-specific serine/threonine protein kinase n=1 Tax=Streptomyces polygonati TaxID=1617087 RepID=A0ABV8I157_9ACTN